MSKITARIIGCGKKHSALAIANRYAYVICPLDKRLGILGTFFKNKSEICSRFWKHEIISRSKYESLSRMELWERVESSLKGPDDRD